jgi:hypothetical protein
MERVAALVPFPFYCFAKPHEDFVWLRESARRVMDAVVDRAVEGGGTREAVCTALGSNRCGWTRWPRCVVNVWSMCGQCVVCGVWCVVCGVWCVVCGVWCVVVVRSLSTREGMCRDTCTRVRP